MEGVEKIVRQQRSFEAILDGTNYNACLIQGSTKTALIDTV
jgi:flavorubredoxin